MLTQNQRSWLRRPGSLTRHLKAHFSDFQVEVLSETWAKPLVAEARHLQIPQGQLAWIRCVRLVCDGQARVYARTVIPCTAQRRVLRQCQHLNTRPLGEWLFCTPHIHRSRFHAMRITHADDSNLTHNVQGRGSVFTLHGQSLLVSEYFLTAMPPIPISETLC